MKKVKSHIIVVILIFLTAGPAWPQDNFLNSRFALISTNYKLHCTKCREISNELFKQMKDEPIFNDNDHYPNWIGAWRSNSWESLRQSQYRGIDFFLTSTIEPKDHDFEVIFTLYDYNKNPYQSESFIQVIESSKLQIDIKSVAESVLKELNDFKSNGHFKNAIIVDNFEIIQSINLGSSYAEMFSDWLASELRSNDIISLNYHVFYVNDINPQDIENKLDGAFFQRNENKLKVTMEIELKGKKKKCKTLNIELIDYHEVNRNDILNEILEKIEELENEN